MSLQFILGGSGAGKTRRLYETVIEKSIQEQNGRFFLIVPEQFTMQTQKEIVSLHPNHGVMNIDIVSFGRLAYRVFEERSIENPEVLDDMGKSMVLRKVMANEKKNLILFQGRFNQNGFVGQVKSVLSELYQYGVEVDTLKQVKEQLKTPIVVQKLEDLITVYEGFQAYIKDQYITTEELLDVLLRVLPKSDYIRDSVIALDGFTGFTPIQYRLIEQFFQSAKEVFITITIDSFADPYKRGNSFDLFQMSRKTIQTLDEMARRNNIEKKEDVVLESTPNIRFKNHEALDFLERNLFRYHQAVFCKEQEEIQIVKAANLLQEIGFLVNEIYSLIHKGGFRYRDIAVITGDLSGYCGELSHQFLQHKIPFFLDSKKSILENPMVEVIRSALEVVRMDFSYESVFRYLKTGLVTEEWEGIYRMENYVRALGIRGYKRFSQPWEWEYRGGRQLDLEALNRLKDEILEPFESLRTCLLRKSATVLDMAKGVVDFLMALEIEQKMTKMEAVFMKKNQHHLAKEYSQVYGLVMDLFHQIVRLLGDESMSQREFSEILDAGFGEIQVGMIPATLDRVVVGDVTRTRLDHVKVLFFLGVNEGIVPAKKDESSFFTDQERHWMSEYEVELAPTKREESFIQRFYLYLLMTKPSEQLILSYSNMSLAGKVLRPSSLLNEVKKVFPRLEAISCEEVLEVRSLKEAKERLIDGLRAYGGPSEMEQKQTLEFLELYRNFYIRDEYREKMKQLVRATFYSYEEKGIGKAAANALYGTTLSGSVTRIEKYAACAYAHFLRYGIELLERDEYEIKPMDIGNLYHDSIDLFFKQMEERNQEFDSLKEEDRIRFVSECVDQVANEYGNTILKSSARNEFLTQRAKKITDFTIWALAKQMKKGDFKPVGFEVSFSDTSCINEASVALSEEELLHLKGRIDRLDVYENETNVYVKVIDYKSGTTSFDLAALYYGLQLQLVVYLDAAVNMQKIKTPGKEVMEAGIFYYNIKHPMVEKQGNMTSEEINGLILKQLKMNGLVSGDLEVISHLDREMETESDVIPVVLKNEDVVESKSSVALEGGFPLLRRFVKEQLKQSGREILDGVVSVSPYRSGTQTACDYCSYHSVCGFDLKTCGYEYRRLKSMKSQEVWEEIQRKEETMYGDEVDFGPAKGY